MSAAFAAAAQALVGAPFRLRGRDPATGVDCVGLVACALARIGRTVRAPVGYSLRALSIEPLLGFAAANGFEPAAGRILPGDLILLRPSPVQHHLAIALDAATLVHAHAGLGRVVSEPLASEQTIARRWRLAGEG